ncbi:MAG: hypothetical protein KDJ53_14610 [Rhodobiaceae bacterium]|nr:hypothetical protein [Rhodobiaceae bacterium]
MYRSFSSEPFMHAIRLFRIASVVAASIALAGCILSQGALFDSADAITPVAQGVYKEMARGESNAFEEVATVNVAIDGKTYNVSSEDGREPAIFTMHDGGNGLIITQIAEDGEAGYALLRIENGEVLHWAAACDVASDIGVLADFPGVEDGEGNCMIPDRDTLIAFMTAYASKAEPDYKYVPVAQ